MKKAYPRSAVFDIHSIPIKHFLLILILTCGLLFSACSDKDEDTNSDNYDYSYLTPAANNSNTTQPPANLSYEEKVELVKKALYTSYAGIGYSTADDQSNAPMYDVMIEDLNLLTVKLVGEALNIQNLDMNMSNEEMLSYLQALLSSVDNDALLGIVQALMNTIQKEDLMMIIGELIANFRELVDRVMEEGIHFSFEDNRIVSNVEDIIVNIMSILGTINIQELGTIFQDQDLIDSIRYLITNMSSWDLSSIFEIDQLISNIEEKISAIKDQEVTNILDGGLINYLPTLIARFMSEGINKISSSTDAVSMTITMTGLENLLTTENAELQLTLFADFNDYGFALDSSSECIYKGNGDGFPDFEAVIVIQTSNTNPMIDIKSIKIKAYDTLHASYPTHNVQYQNWTVSYDIDIAGFLNASLLPLPLIGDLVQYVEGFKDNRDYTFTGGYKLDDKAYDFTNMLYIQEEKDTETSLLIEGAVSVPDTNLTIDVASDALISDTYGVWSNGKMYFMIDKDVFKVDFHSDGSATIDNSETVSAWQENLNPMD